MKAESQYGKRQNSFEETAGFWDQLGSLGQRSKAIAGNRASTTGLILVLALGYYFFGRLAFLMAVSEGSAISVAFLPEGLALAFTILFGCRVAPGIFLGQLVLTLSLGDSIAVSAAFGIISTIGGCAGGWLFWRWRISPGLDSTSDIVRLVGLSALVIQPLSALLRVVSQMAFDGATDVYHLLFHSWAGNTTGQLLLVPLLLSFCSNGFQFDRSEFKRSLFILLVYSTGIVLFVAADLGGVDRIYWPSIFVWFYLMLTWVAINSSTLVTALLSFLLTMGFLWAIVVSPDFYTQVQVLYADVMISGGVVTSLLIASLLSHLRERTAQLTRANHAKEHLLAVIGHDLRSPIVNLSTALDLVKGGRMEQSEFFSIKKHLRLVTDNTRWTLENIMEWAAMQLDDIKPMSGPCQVRSIAEDALDLLHANADSKDIHLVNDVGGGALVWVDRHHLESILRNLLSNAIKFTERGGRVRLSSSRSGKCWRITVEDNGVGMTPEQMDRLFVEEMRFPTSVGTARERGAGLGLRIVSRFLKANGGFLCVESVEGKGSVLHFTLPIPPECSRRPQSANDVPL